MGEGIIPWPAIAPALRGLPCVPAPMADNAGRFCFRTLLPPLTRGRAALRKACMSLLVVGSVAIDSIHTPTAVRENVLGGSAVHFSYAASFFAPVQLVGVVGDDFPAEHVRLLQSRKIDTAGLKVVPGGKTFAWTGKYAPNMNDRETLEVHLNVFGDFLP